MYAPKPLGPGPFGRIGPIGPVIPTHGSSSHSHPVICPVGYHNVGGKCVLPPAPTPCPPGYHRGYDGSCVRNTPAPNPGSSSSHGSHHGSHHGSSSSHGSHHGSSSSHGSSSTHLVCPAGMHISVLSGKCVPNTPDSSSSSHSTHLVCPAGMHLSVLSGKCVPNTPAPNPTNPCPPGYHKGYDGSCVRNTPAPNPSVHCGLGSVYSPEEGRCVPFVHCPPGTTYNPATGRCDPGMGPHNVCNFTSPYVCSPSQWVEYRGMSEAQFLGATTQPCGAGGIAWGASNLYW